MSLTVASAVEPPDALNVLQDNGPSRFQGFSNYSFSSVVKEVLGPRASSPPILGSEPLTNPRVVALE